KWHTRFSRDWSSDVCSSELTERRYLVVPGTHSSRIHVVDTRPDPRSPRLVKVIEGEEVMEKTGYAAPHTVHCGPDGIYMNALGRSEERRIGKTCRGRWRTAT